MQSFLTQTFTERSSVEPLEALAVLKVTWTDPILLSRLALTSAGAQ